MSLELRPTFSVDLDEPCTVVAERLRAGLERQPVWTKWSRVPGARIERSCGDTFVLVAVPEKQQRFYSPWLQVSIHPREQGTHLFGRFGPRPAVWSAFLLSYLFCACVGFFSLMWALSQMVLGGRPWAGWITLGAVTVAGLLWWASQIGKRLADEQMATLRRAFDQAVSRDA